MVEPILQVLRRRFPKARVQMSTGSIGPVCVFFDPIKPNACKRGHLIAMEHTTTPWAALATASARILHTRYGQ